MNCFHLKTRLLSAALVVFAFVAVFSQPAAAQVFDFTRVIPEKDANGVTLPGANTTFADGSTFVPAGNDSRSVKWAYRPFGNNGVLSSLGLSLASPPTSTKELVTTVTGLKPGTPYAVKVLFWDTEVWGVRAGLTYAHELRTNQWFDTNTTGVVAADMLPWGTMPAVFSESGRILYAGPVGTATANSNGEVKVYIHDLPTGDANRRTWYQGIAVAEVIASASHLVDAGLAGTRFSRGTRGLALSDGSLDRGEYWVGIPKALWASTGGAIRGVSTGIAAELYDWRNRNGQPRPPTLQFLRYSRDFSAELFLGVNLRGLVQANPSGGFSYYDTQPSTLASMAADWVRYVNHIVPSYRQGDLITDPRDAAILNSLTWSSSFTGDSFDKLLAPGEGVVPQIKYWEIGNEPTIGVSSFSVSNSFTLNATNYYARYKAVVQAMKVENPGVKVGPTLIDGVRDEAQLAAIVSDPSLPIDFITYHPYEKMGLLNDPSQITQFLGSVSSHQRRFLNDLKNVVAQNGRDPESLEYAATEVCVSDWVMNDTEKEANIAHALGTVETIFSHAKMGLISSLYWIWPAHRYDGTEYPVYKAFEKLRDHMGDTLVSSYIYRDIRLYTTRDSRTGQIAVWMLNFSNDQDTTVELKLQNLPTVQRATLLRLQDTTTKTTLFSSNLATSMAGGPTTHVDWTSSTLTNVAFADFALTLPAATISVVVIEPGVSPLAAGLVDQPDGKRLAVTFRRTPNASNLRYNLLSSDDLVNWTVIAETEAGTSEEVSILDTRPLNSSRRFLRVKVVSQ